MIRYITIIILVGLLVSGVYISNNTEANTNTQVRTATYIIAASDSATHMKEHADYVCDGTEDNIEIQNAIYSLVINGIPYGGKVWFARGTYNIAETIEITPSCVLEGESLGWDYGVAKGVKFNYVGDADSVVIDASGVHWVGISGIRVSTEAEGCTGLLMGGDINNRTRESYIHDMGFYDLNTGIALGKANGRGSDDTSFDRIMFSNCNVGLDAGGYEATSDTFNQCKFSECGVGILIRDWSIFRINDSYFSANDIDIGVSVNSTNYVGGSEDEFILICDKCGFEMCNEAIFKNLTTETAYGWDVRIINTIHWGTNPYEVDAVYFDFTNFDCSNFKFEGGEFTTTDEVIISDGNQYEIDGYRLDKLIIQ